MWAVDQKHESINTGLKYMKTKLLLLQEHNLNH